MTIIGAVPQNNAIHNILIITVTLLCDLSREYNSSISSMANRDQATGSDVGVVTVTIFFAARSSSSHASLIMVAAINFRYIKAPCFIFNTK